MCQDLRRTAMADAIPIFVKGDVAPMVGSVLYRTQMLTNDFSELRRRGFGERSVAGIESYRHGRLGINALFLSFTSGRKLASRPPSPLGTGLAIFTASGSSRG